MPTQENARQHLQQLIDRYNETDRFANLTEADVVQKYIEPLLRDVLGWDLSDSARYLKELHTVAGRPDLRLTAENGDVIYVEAKKFGIIDKLEKYDGKRYMGDLERRQVKVDKRLGGALRPEQLALPTMSIDRTAEEQQAINYAFKNGSDWAILTNFERLRLFNARRDWLVLSFEDPADFLHDFDLLWQLSYDNILSGSLDYLSNQRYREDVDKAYLKLINTWRQELANDLIQSEAQNLWIRENGQLALPVIRSVVQRIIDRLVVVRFAEDHLVINPGTLNGFYDLRHNNIYAPSMISLVQTLFRNFDQEHNSALFSQDRVDEAVFSDDVLMQLVADLYKVKFRAMPADILGNTYEQYLGKALVLDDDTVVTRDNLETRKKQGSYYTPQVIVRYIVDNSLGRYLYGTDNGKATGEPLAGETRKTSRDIKDLRVLDSACGSGSFLIYAYEVLRDFYESEIQRLDEAYKEGIDVIAKNPSATVEDNVAVRRIEMERDRLRNYPRIILEQHLYGVDLDPQAAEIAVVNLMMRAMEKQGTEKRLPLILNQNIKVGNALIGARPDDSRLQAHQATLARIRQLRADLKATDHTTPEHDQILDDLNSALATLRTTLNADYAEHFSDIERVRLFHWAVEFPEAFVDADGAPLANSGFQVIIGNPPWEIVKPDLREFYAQFDADIESRLSRKKAEASIDELNAENPELEAQWDDQKAHIEAQASYYRATDDYTRQGRGDTATHKLFVERVYGLLRDSGRLGYVVPSGIYSDLGTKDLREMIFSLGCIESLVSITNGVSGGDIYFASVHRSYKVSLLITYKGDSIPFADVLFRIDPRLTPKPENLLEYTADRDKFIRINWSAVKQLSSRNHSFLEFTDKKEYEIIEKLLSKAPAIGVSVEDGWNPNFVSGLHKTNQRHLFNMQGQGLPIFEGKNFSYYGEQLREPEYWMTLENGQGVQSDYTNYRFGFRRIGRGTDIRTLIVSYLPKNSFAMYTLTTLIQEEITKKQEIYLYSCMASFILDFLIRPQVSSSVAIFNVKTLPIFRLTEGNPYFEALVQRAAQLTCTRPEFAELWQDVMGSAWEAPDGNPSPKSGRDLEAISENEEKGLQALKPVVDSVGRQQLRDEIDAIVAHLYGLSRAEFAHILGTFPLVFPDDAGGKAKKEALLAEYDRWQALVQGWSRQ